MCSALARRTATAMVMTYLLLLVLFVLPMGVEYYLQGISSVSETQLAALTVTSPFSAALSVPMHTTRGEAWLNQPPAVADDGPGPHHRQTWHAGVGALPLHLSAAVPWAFRGDVPGVPLAVVVRGGMG